VLPILGDSTPTVIGAVNRARSHPTFFTSWKLIIVSSSLVTDQVVHHSELTPFRTPSSCWPYVLLRDFRAWAQPGPGDERIWDSAASRKGVPTSVSKAKNTERVSALMSGGSNPGLRIACQLCRRQYGVEGSAEPSWRSRGGRGGRLRKP
jgi:hypothetical protein